MGLYSIKLLRVRSVVGKTEKKYNKPYREKTLSKRLENKQITLNHIYAHKNYLKNDMISLDINNYLIKKNPINIDLPFEC